MRHSGHQSMKPTMKKHYPIRPSTHVPRSTCISATTTTIYKQVASFIRRISAPTHAQRHIWKLGHLVGTQPSLQG